MYGCFQSVESTPINQEPKEVKFLSEENFRDKASCIGIASELTSCGLLVGAVATQPPAAGMVAFAIGIGATFCGGCFCFLYPQCAPRRPDID